jgi:putative hydrolase of the HAD superfamily
VFEFDAILFDAGGVLVLPDPTVLAPLLAPYGASESLAVHVRAHYGAMAAKSRAGDGESDWVSYDEAYVELIGVPAANMSIAAKVLGRTRTAYLWRWPIPDSLTALRRLHDGGTAIGVVSNASGQVEDALRHFGICQAGNGPLVPMRVIIDSHYVGVAKPDPAIFDHALPAFSEFERSRIAYVGDSVTMDIGAATAAGLLPVLLDPYDDHPNSSFARIRSLHDLVR